LFHAEPDVIGTPFYEMERLDGRIFSDNTLPNMAATDRRAIYLATAENMALLHRLD
jgi:aminoglycoside phosphotransferase (APT) family kinase protein